MAALALARFHRDLYGEHVEDIAFLYEQRLALMRKPGFAWPDLAPFEARLEAHLDALVVGGDEALSMCTQEALWQGEAGEVFASASLFCRQQRSDLMARVLQSLDGFEASQQTALADALKHDMPETWHGFIAQALSQGAPQLAPVLAIAAGYRRLPVGAALAGALSRLGATAPAADLVVLIEAAGRIHAHEARDLIAPHVRHADPRVQAAALLALQRLGASDLWRPAASAALHAPWAWNMLAISGDTALMPLLVKALENGHDAVAALHALGLLGDPRSLRVIYDALGEPEIAPAAAQALSWITGARPQECVHIAEPVDEAALFPKELAAWRQYREAPRRADGLAFGETARQLSARKEAWKQWFAEHGANFQGDVRYRRGTPASRAALLADLGDAGSDALLRTWSALELEIRHGCPLAWEADMPVAQQGRLLARMAQWSDGDVK